MALDAAGVEQLQNSTPTDWNRFDQDLTNRSSSNANRFKDDAKLHVRFYSAPMIDVEASNAANRAIYKQVEMVEIMMPGDKNNIIRDMVWDQHRQRFPEKYSAFKAGLSQDIGSPLAVLPFMTESRIKEFEFFNIKTVEQLANLSDTVKQKFMGADTLAEQARQWLAKFNSVDSVRAEVAADSAKKDQQIAALQAQVAELIARMQPMPPATEQPRQQGNVRR